MLHLGIDSGQAECMAIVKELEFTNGTIECEVNGKTILNAPQYAKGFIGIGFRVQKEPGGYNYECIYLRPLNSRSQNQLTRNRTVQYSAEPEFPWHRLRSETPSQYESYVDVAPDKWTKIRIEVSGKTARLFVNQSEQPSLIVNDLKLGERKGAVAIWSEATTVALVRELVVESK